MFSPNEIRQLGGLVRSFEAALWKQYGQNLSSKDLQAFQAATKEYAQQVDRIAAMVETNDFR